jgi:hypothetical protein
VASGLGEDTGVAETGNKLGEVTVFPNPGDLLANCSKKNKQHMRMNIFFYENGCDAKLSGKYETNLEIVFEKVT